MIHVYKSGFRKKHMPKAELGDKVLFFFYIFIKILKVLVAIRGEMKKGFIVGCNYYHDIRKHGVPSTDTNNIVLLVFFFFELV